MWTSNFIEHRVPFQRKLILNLYIKVSTPIQKFQPHNTCQKQPIFKYLISGWLTKGKRIMLGRFVSHLIPKLLSSIKKLRSNFVRGFIMQLFLWWLWNMRQIAELHGGFWFPYLLLVPYLKCCCWHFSSVCRFWCWLIILVINWKSVSSWSKIHSLNLRSLWCGNWFSSGCDGKNFAVTLVLLRLQFKDG